MILNLPTSASLAQADAFALALDALTPDRSISQSGTRFVVHDSDTLTDGDRAAIRALVREHGGSIEGDAPPKALAHGAEAASQAALLRWANNDNPTAFPRLERIDTVAHKGFIAREAWYRVEDVVYGLSTTPAPGASPVYEVVYTSWTWGTLPSSTDHGITERGPRTKRFYAEDGSVFLAVDEGPKAYSYRSALEAGTRRRVNVVGSSDNMTSSRVAEIVLGALLETYPTSDPGLRVADLLGALNGAVRAYRASGQVLHAALADPALTVAFPWLLTLLGGVPAITLLSEEVEDPADGVVTL